MVSVMLFWPMLIKFTIQRLVAVAWLSILPTASPTKHRRPLVKLIAFYLLLCGSNLSISSVYLFSRPLIRHASLRLSTQKFILLIRHSSVILGTYLDQFDFKL